MMKRVYTLPIILSMLGKYVNSVEMVMIFVAQSEETGRVSDKGLPQMPHPNNGGMYVLSTVLSLSMHGCMTS